MKATFERIINSQNEKIRVFEDEKEENESLITQNELTMKNQV